MWELSQSHQSHRDTPLPQPSPLAAVGGPVMVPMVQRGVPVPRQAGAFPGHRLPSTASGGASPRPCSRPCPCPCSRVPVTPLSPSFTPAAFRGTRAGATTRRSCPHVPRAAPSPPRAVPKTPPCPSLWPLCRDRGRTGLAVAPRPPLDPAPGVSRQCRALAQRSLPAVLRLWLRTKPLSAPVESPWQPVLAPTTPCHVPPGAKGPPNSVHVWPVTLPCTLSCVG